MERLNPNPSSCDRDIEELALQVLKNLPSQQTKLRQLTSMSFFCTKPAWRLFAV